VTRAKKNGKWTAPVGAFTDFSMPPELSGQLKREKKAARFFESLAPSYQRQYIAWIATAKRPETKKRRLHEAIELLKRGEKLGMR
ncbi:MAG: YdeI/OmpD-associated family protein, partial [Gammaproteobacteria bacterium]|nr:YdeI/OmpD-associated family protein [Gammaproteobacteria bacterium]